MIRAAAMLALFVVPTGVFAGASAADALADAPGTYEPAIRAILDETATAPSPVPLRDLSRWRSPITALYQRRAFQPLWFVDGRLQPSGRALLTELHRIERRGLFVADYDGARLLQLAARPDSRTAADVESIVGLDVAVTVNAVRLVSDLSAGRVRPASVGYELDIPRAPLDMASEIAQLAATTEVARSLDLLEPQLRHFSLLKDALSRYRALAQARSHLTILPALPRRSVEPGEQYQGAAALRTLLVALGDAPPTASNAEGPLFDDALVEALRRFQKRHGLEADGILGPRTYQELSTPFSTRVEQIELTMERVRWLPKLESAPIIVNIPQFRLFAFRTTNDFASEILQMDVIVGSAFEGRRTPVFAAHMRYVVLNPYWDVPRSILVKELQSGIQADPRWVERNGYEIVAGQGDDATPLAATAASVGILLRGGARLRQRPGSLNSLGRVKFMFPNRHNVYLHDTPARELFARSRRAFSHGCIRVSEPMQLLAHVLRNEPAWTAQRLQEALDGGQPMRIRLSVPISVFILYGTVLATEAGETMFFEDLYGQDAVLAKALRSRA